MDCTRAAVTDYHTSRHLSRLASAYTVYNARAAAAAAQPSMYGKDATGGGGGADVGGLCRACCLWRLLRPARRS